MADAHLPEMANIDSAAFVALTQTEAEKEGALGSLYPFVSLHTLDPVPLYLTLGEGPYLLIEGTPALLDLHYVDHQLTKITLRDTAKTDVTEYTDALGIRTTIPRDKYAIFIPDGCFVATLAIGSDVDAWTREALSCGGAAKQLLERLCPRDPDTNSVEASLSHSMTQSLVDITTCAEDGVAQSQIYEMFTANALPDICMRPRMPMRIVTSYHTLTFSKQDAMNVAFLYNSDGKGAIFLKDYPYLLHGIITRHTSVFGNDGTLYHKLQVTPVGEKRSVISSVDHTLLITSGATVTDAYEVGRHVSYASPFTPHLVKLVASEHRVATKKSQICPACNHKLLQGRHAQICFNHRCPGVVAQRLSNLASWDNWAIPGLANISYAQQVIVALICRHRPIHLISAVQQLASGIDVVPSDLQGIEGNDIMSTVRHRLGAIANPRSEHDWMKLKSLIVCLGFYDLPQIDIAALMSAADRSFEVPLSILVKTLRSATALHTVANIPIDRAVIIARDADRRYGELDMLLTLTAVA